MIRETRMPDGRRILTAWERAITPINHGTITFIDGDVYGKVTTRELPQELDMLPAYSDERLNRVAAYHESLRQESYALIRTARPDATMGEERYGEIWL